jgi:hypothetical protein
VHALTKARCDPAAYELPKLSAAAGSAAGADADVLGVLFARATARHIRD